MPGARQARQVLIAGGRAGPVVVQALRRGPGGTDPAVRIGPRAAFAVGDGADDPSRRLLCAWCRAPVTTVGERIEVAGAHLHAFVNPVGVRYEISCFRRAPGCVALGRPSAEFSWFPGMAWQVGICRRCREHLGWRYVVAAGGDLRTSRGDGHASIDQTGGGERREAKGSGFFGLVRAALIPEEERP